VLFIGTQLNNHYIIALRILLRIYSAEGCRWEQQLTRIHLQAPSRPHTTIQHIHACTHALAHTHTQSHTLTTGGERDIMQEELKTNMRKEMRQNQRQADA
jgi:hypothetical protein